MGNNKCKLFNLIIALIIVTNFCKTANSKRWTTEDAVVFENDPPARPGPSLFDYVDLSNSPKVKRGSKTPERYYEMIDDEVYVFEPSSLGAQPFMEAMQPEEQEEPRQRHVIQESHPHFFQHQPTIRHQPYKPYNQAKQKIPLYIKPLHFNELRFSNQNIHKIQSSNSEIDSDVNSISHSEVRVEAHGDCFTQTEKEGYCVPFRICYPVVFNMIDGQLRNPGLAKILYKASGPCDKNNSLNDFDEVVKPDLRSNEDPNFYNDTVCCPGLNEVNSIPQESRAMKPSLPDPEYHPHSPLQFDTIESDASLGSEADLRSNANSGSEPGRDSDANLGLDSDTGFDSDTDSDPDNESGSDYYMDEYDDHHHTFTTTEIPKITPKTLNNSTTNSSSSESELINNAVIADESNRSEVKVESNLKANKSSRSHNEKKITSKLMKSQNGTVSTVVPASHMSAWNCPGRQIGMPRGHWPWMVALLNEGIHVCTGSLIDHRHILTSATCINSFQGKDIGKLRVILGDRVLYSSIDGPHIWRKIVRITRHIQYNPMTMEHDIAMLEMDMSVSYTPNIQPINLPTSDDRSHATKAIVSGWSGPDIGKRFFVPRTANDAIVEFMDMKDCRVQYDGFISGGLPHDLICTKPSNLSCGADPGTGLVMKTENCWHIVGILSNGLGCGLMGEIFTDTARHMAWIQKNIRQHVLVHERHL